MKNKGTHTRAVEFIFSNGADAANFRYLNFAQFTQILCEKILERGLIFIFFDTLRIRGSLFINV